MRKFIFLTLLLFLLFGCTATNSKTAVTPTIIVPTPKSLPSSTPTPTKNENSGIVVVISGTVKDVLFSTRVITLGETDSDFNQIALTEESDIADSNGNERSLSDIHPGMIIQVAGQPDDSNVLLAYQVLIFVSMPISPNAQSNEQQIDAINIIRTTLDLPELPLQFIGLNLDPNSPSGNLEVAQYQDTEGRTYSIDPRINNVIEIDARSMLLNISPDAPQMSQEELEKLAQKLFSATIPDFENRQTQWRYEQGNKIELYFFNWYDETSTGFMMRPSAQIGLHKTGQLFAYYNSLLLQE